ncbi:hypothetical protein QR680_004735 [Steinernema hermaphroditum]|uniref:Galectin n=1 Tax=Steinernema hermaphroditum TaxID=289476 RepID=A0AA39HQU5_9BILA|nr:hypothetical protein QR680_004735 [Steinernema hermaphroditum]
MLLWSGRLLLLLWFFGILDAAASSSRAPSRRWRHRNPVIPEKYRRTLDGKNKQKSKVSLPSIIDIFEPFSLGESIRIEGRFSVDLKDAQKDQLITKEIERGEIVDPYEFWIPQDSKERGVMNSLQPGKPFVILICITDRNDETLFNIIVNHKIYAYLTTSHALGLITQISLDGDAVIDHVEWGGLDRDTPLFETFPLMLEGRVVVNGAFTEETFEMALLDPMLEKAFYFTVRFNEKTALANSYLKNAWGLEERASKFPFDQSQHFELMLLVNVKEVRVVVDGELILTFKHRTANPLRDYIGVWVNENALVYNIVWN